MKPFCAPMWYQFRNPHFYLMLLADAILLAVAHIGSYLLRFEFEPSPMRIEQIRLLLPYIVPFKLAVFYGFGLYWGMWRYAGIEDLWQLVRASLLTMLSLITFVLLTNRFEGFSRAVFLLDGFLTFLLAGGLRIGIRLFYAPKNSGIMADLFHLSRNATREQGWKRALIIGAGNAGEQILRQIFNNSPHQYHVVGFLDDNRAKQGRSVHGVPVLGPVVTLPHILQKQRIDEVLITIPSANSSQIRRIVESCKRCNVPNKILPTLSEIIDGKVTIRDLRNVDYEDLLGRPPVQLDMAEISDYLLDQVVLVTGCGGSIGSELCRKIVRFQPRNLILVDAGEENLFRIQMELHHELNYRNYYPILGRVQNQALIENVFRKFRPDVVFHAAAYKHVPMIEINPWEAVFNNILASLVAMEMSSKYKAQRFVLLSTDKAVRPTNVMGASKRVVELLLQSFDGDRTRFMAVRFGNVVGSSGSVIPLFERQIEHGGPVTVTHPEVTRYFMTISEASQLILQAGAMGKGGEIFILKMGTPVKILKMAEDLIRLSGKEPVKDIKIDFTGLREGEKLYEELITVGEDIVETGHEKIMVLQSDGNCNGFASPDQLQAWLSENLAELYKLALRMDSSAIKRKLQEIVPEYTPQDTRCVL